MNNIWLTDSDLPWFQHGPIEALSQASSGFASGWLICAEKNQLHIATLPLDSKPSNVSRRRPVKGSPRRVIYSPRLRKLIVLCEEVSISPLKGLKGYSSRSNQRCLKPMILFVDPESDMSDSDEKDRLPIKACQPGERFLGVAEWYLDVDDQIKHILVINTTLENMPHSPSGRILLFHVSTEGELTLRTTVNRDFPVYDLIPYSTRSLLYCCGLDLCLHTLTIIPEKLERSRWHDPVIFHLGSSGRHLSVNDSFVYVSTVGNGLSIFKIEDNNIIPQFNDESARDDLYHLNMPERSLILTSQRNRSVAGLWQPPQKRINNSTSTVFEAMLTGSITRFRRINRPLWQQSLKADTMKENIIGCSTDGTMHQFEILDESSWRLLLFVQNLVTRSPTICPHANLAQSYRRALEPSSKNPLNMHVNGDILHRLFERDGERILISLLEDQSILDIISAQEPIFRIVLAQHPRCCSTMEAKSLTRELVTRELATIEGAARRRLFRKFAKGVGLENDSDSDDWVRQVLGWIELKIRKVM